MVEFQRKARKSRALAASAGPACASGPGAYGLNLVHGCPFDCLYCSFRARPYERTGWVELFSELPVQLAEELAMLRRRRKAAAVVRINTATDAFFGMEEVDAIASKCISVICDAKACVVLQTKGVLAQSVIQAIIKHRSSVSLIATMAAVDETFRKVFEPKVPPVQGRRKQLFDLVHAGVDVRGRLEPLVPMFNDSDAQVEACLREFSRAGISRVATSYMQMDNDLRARLKGRLSASDAALVLDSYMDVSGLQMSLPDREYRIRRYRSMLSIAARLGLRLTVCACRNPDVSRTYCYEPPVPPKARAPQVLV